jgi:NAD(P)-dependent dehydrogenase (short-subunit alcohol dehydrogenase family)
MNLIGKVALITGAGAGGIGEACARRLADLGATVVITDVQDSLGQEVADKLGQPHRYMHLDVTSPDEWRQTLKTVVADLGRLDIVHCNAGTHIGRAASGAEDPLAVVPGFVEADPISLLDERSFRTTIAVNVDGVYFGVLSALPYLEATKGSILVTCSLASIAPHPSDPLYALSKHALVGLIVSIGESLAERGVTINGLCPGPTLTKAAKDWWSSAGAKDAIPALVGANVMEPSDMAVAFSEVLASGQTGSIWVKMFADQPVYRHVFPGVPGWSTDD